MKICIHFTCFFNMFILFKNTFRNENITVLINMFYKNSTLNLGGFINVIRRFFYFTCHKWISNAPLQHTSTVIQNSRFASDNAINIYIQYIMIDILRWINSNRTWQDNQGEKRCFSIVSRKKWRSTDTANLVQIKSSVINHAPFMKVVITNSVECKIYETSGKVFSLEFI